MADSMRVMLDFKKFVNYPNSGPQKCWYLIKKKFIHNIEDLQNDLISKFSEDGSHCDWSTVDLYVDGCLVPPWEDVNVIRDGDVINVCSTEKDHRYGGSKRKTACREKELELQSPDNKKCKREKQRDNQDTEADNNQNEAVLETHTHNTKKRKKDKTRDKSPGILVETVPENHDGNKKKHKKDKKKRKEHTESCDANDTGEIANTTPSVTTVGSDKGASAENNIAERGEDCEETSRAGRVVGEHVLTSTSITPDCDSIVNTSCPKVNEIEDGLCTNKDETVVDDAKPKKRNRRRKRKRPVKCKIRDSIGPCLTELDPKAPVVSGGTKNETIAGYDSRFNADIASDSGCPSRTNHLTFKSDSENDEMNVEQVTNTAALPEDYANEKTAITESHGDPTSDGVRETAGTASVSGLKGSAPSQRHQNHSAGSYEGTSDSVLSDAALSKGVAQNQTSVAVYDLVSSKMQHHMNGSAQFQLVAGAKVFDRRKHKKRSNFSLTQAVELSRQDVYTNQSFIFEEADGDTHHGGGGEEAIAQCKEKEPVKDYSKFPALYGAPRVGDLIAYKVLEMSDDYSPGLSEYKEAKVIEFEPASQMLKLELTACKGGGIRGRFHCEIEDENEILTIEKEYVGLRVDVALSSLVEPKLVTS